MPDMVNTLVGPQATISPNTYFFSFGAQVGGQSPGSQFMLVSNSGLGNFSGLRASGVTYSSNGTGWLTVIQDTNFPGSFTLTCTLGALSAAIYTATFQLLDTNATNSPTTITVQFQVAAVASPAVIQLSPSSLAFTGTAGGSAPANQTIAVTNGGGLPFAGLTLGAITYGLGSGWLTVDLTGNTITVTANPASLSAANYTASFPITDANANNSPQTVHVTFAVSAVASPFITVTPDTSLSFGGTAGDATPIAPQTRTITNTGSGSLAGPALGAITYNSGSGWITARSITTNLAGQNYTLSVTVATGALAGGTTYTASFNITDANATNSPIPVSVSFAVAVGQPPGNFPQPKYTLPRGSVSNATFDTTTNKITWNSFTNNGIAIPDGNPNSPTFAYGASGTLNPGVATTRNVTSQATFQSALNAAVKGDIIEVTSSFTITSQVTFPAKAIGDWVLIRCAPGPGVAEGVRVSPAVFASASTPKISVNIAAAQQYAMVQAAQSHCWHFRDVFMENAQNPGELAGFFVWGAWNGGNGNQNVGNVPKQLIVERCYLNNPWDNTTKFLGRHLYLQGQYAIIKDNYFAGAARNNSSDSQSILMGDCLGSILIENNFLEGASENVMCGGQAVTMGAQAYGNNLVIRKNHIRKDPAWLVSTSRAYGQTFNFFELKHGQYVLFEDNYCENHPGVGQQQDINIKCSPYAQSEVAFLKTGDVTIRNNYLTNGVGCLNLTSGDSHAPLPSNSNFPLSRVEVHNNAWGPRFSAWRTQVGGLSTPTFVMTEISITHNLLRDNNSFVSLIPASITNNANCIASFTFANNLCFSTINSTSSCVVDGNGQNVNGKPTLDKYCGTTGWVFANNAGVSTAGASQLYGSGSRSLSVAPYNNKHYASLGTAGTGTVNSGPLGADVDNVNSTLPVRQGSTKLAVAAGGGGNDAKDIGPDWAQLNTALNAHS